MAADGLSWNGTLIRQLFLRSVADHINRTPINNMKLDRAIWYPSTSGKFTTKSAYNLLLKERDVQQQLTDVTYKVTKDLWSANLHGRHKLMLWKWMNKDVPTLDRI